MLSACKNIVFICTGNTCRSVMAEYYFRKRILEVGKKEILVSSAGTAASPAFKVPGTVIRILQKESISSVDHSPKTVTEKIAEEAELVLCMENHQVLSLRMRFPALKEKIVLLHEFAKGRKKDILDPIGQSDDFYELTFRDIKSCIEDMIKKI